MKKFILSIFFTLFLSSAVFAQRSFSLSDTALYIVKTNTDVAVYHFTQFKNLSRKPLLLRWVKKIMQPFPDKWRTTVQDPQNFYTEHEKDSADFILQEEAGTYDKFIAHVLPNWQVGKGTVQYYIFNTEDRKDGVWVNFHFEIEFDPLSANDEKTDFKTLWQINADGSLTANRCVSEVFFFDETGKMLFSVSNLAAGEKFCFDGNAKLIFWRARAGDSHYSGKYFRVYE
jgi:hypothetical protein